MTAGLILALLITEFAVRLFVTPTHLVRFQQTSQALGSQSAQFVEIMESDPDRFWRLKPGITLGSDLRPFFGLISNEAGLREDHEINYHKGPNEIRVLFLGDSCTFGYLLEHTQSFVELTETELQRRFPDMLIECINAGFPGYTLFQGWRYFETEGLKYEPDLVVLNFGLNDLATWDGRSEVEHYEYWQRTLPPKFLRWSRLAQLVRGRLAGKLEEVQPGSARPRVTSAEYRDLLEKITRSTRQHHAGVLLLIGGTRLNLDPARPQGFQTPLQAEGQRFARILAVDSGQLGGAVDAVAIAESLSTHYPIDRIYLDNVHPSYLLNQEIARHLANRISAWLDQRFRNRELPSRGIQGRTAPPSHSSAR